MKKFKKIAASISAGVMCLSVAPLSSTAATGSNTYWIGDVDGNSIVNLRDVSWLQSFLCGASKTSDKKLLDRMDVSMNGVIDEVDMRYLENMFLSGSTSTTAEYSTDTVAPLAENLGYRVFDANTGNYKTDYSILNPDNELGSATSQSQYASQILSVRSIIGNDNRYAENGFSGVVKLNHSGAQGTAFVIGKHTLLTAAHCVSGAADTDGLVRTIASGINFEIYGNNNQLIRTIETEDIKDVHIPLKYITAGQIDESRYEQYDYALITVEEDLSEYVNFKLGVPISQSRMSEEFSFVAVTGFGSGEGDPNVNQAMVGIKSTGSGSVTEISDKNIYYTADAYSGDSGAPVYTSFGQYNTVVGIHTRGGNFGTKVSTGILQFVYDNPYLRSNNLY